MPNAFLVIGVGGAGRGVCNLLKYEVEREFGSLERVKTRILVIDGPPNDENYAVAGKFQINTSPGSEEFYQAARSPATEIKNVANGHDGPQEKYIKTWLSQAEAARIPIEAMDPKTGFGGHRTPGHAFVFVDAGGLNGRLTAAYKAATALVGAGAAGGQAQNQVVTIVVGSFAGGTGAGIVLDVVSMVRQIATGAPVLLFLPMSNIYQYVFSSPGPKLGLNAKGFAGVMNLERMMAGSTAFPVIQRYSDLIVTHNALAPDVPFLVDGEVAQSLLVGVHPAVGLVPAVEDFIMSLVRDQSGAQSYLQPDVINWINRIGTASPENRFNRFGVSSLRYASFEVLEAFRYRFAFTLLDEILDSTGGAKQKGATEAKSLLSEGGRFTTMVSGPEAVSLDPQKFRALASEISFPLPISARLPFPKEKLADTVPHGGIWPFHKAPVEVAKAAGSRMNALLNQVDEWSEKQRARLVDFFLKRLEERTTGIFYDSQNGNLVPRTLAQSPSSIVICAKMLENLQELFQRHSEYVQSQYTALLYPNGTQNPSLINVGQQKVNEAEDKMNRDDTNQNQETYLRRCQDLLELQVWDRLISTVQGINEDIREKGGHLLREVGSSAGGWVDVLRQQKDVIESEYDSVIDRRRKLDEFRLRRYLPKTAGRAEDALFAEIASSLLDRLKGQMSWEFTVDVRNGKFNILLAMPEVEGFDQQAAESYLRNLFGGQAVPRVFLFNVFKLVRYGENEMKPGLERKTIWEVMQLDFDEGWTKKKSIPKEDKALARYVGKLCDELFSRSEPSLDCAAANAIQADPPKILASTAGLATPVMEAFLGELRVRGAKISDSVAFSKVITRVRVDNCIPLKSWKSYAAFQSEYIQYLGEPAVQVDVYPHEQNAARLRKIIVEKIDNNFSGVLCVEIRRCLYDYDVFRGVVLSYLLDLIPTRVPAGASEALGRKRYSVELSSGTVELAETWDVQSLLQSACQPERQTGPGQWIPNADVHEAIQKLWEPKAVITRDDGARKRLFIEDLTKRAEGFVLPNVPSHVSATDPRRMSAEVQRHLKLVFRAVVKDFCEAFAEA